MYFTKLSQTKHELFDLILAVVAPRAFFASAVHERSLRTGFDSRKQVQSFLAFLKSKNIRFPFVPTFKKQNKSIRKGVFTGLKHKPPTIYISGCSLRVQWTWQGSSRFVHPRAVFARGEYHPFTKYPAGDGT